MSTLQNTHVQYLGLVQYPGYEVGDDGTVWSYRNCGHKLKPIPRQLKLCANKQKGGYYYVKLRTKLNSKNREQITVDVHTLVLIAFRGYPQPGQQARHFPDPNPANNHLSNLSWGTVSDNHNDKLIHGTALIGEKNPSAKLTSEDVRVIRLLRGIFSQTELSIMFDVHRGTIRKLWKNTRWKHA